MQNKVVLITGAASGIGAACARIEASLGHKVCINYLQSRDKAEALCAEIRDAGGTAIAVQADLRIEAQVAMLFDAVKAELGQVNGLINNAGIITPLAKVEEMSADRIKSVFESNVLSAFLCCKYAVREMSTNYGGLGGSIVNVSSAASRLGSPNEFVDYAASKGAMDTMTLGLSKELASQGIRVNAVRPGLIDTELHAKGGAPDRPERLKNNIPMLRSGSADEVAKSISWLLNDDSSYVTGALLDVSGGR